MLIWHGPMKGTKTLQNWIWEGIGRLLGASWEPLGRFWRPPGRSWGPPGRSWGPLGRFLGASWVLLVSSWASDASKTPLRRPKPPPRPLQDANIPPKPSPKPHFGRVFSLIFCIFIENCDFVKIVLPSRRRACFIGFEYSKKYKKSIL